MCFIRSTTAPLFRPVPWNKTKRFEFSGVFVLPSSRPLLSVPATRKHYCCCAYPAAATKALLRPSQLSSCFFVGEGGGRRWVRWTPCKAFLSIPR